jgi:8-amino-7-oxononanoate synthase
MVTHATARLQNNARMFHSIAKTLSLNTGHSGATAVCPIIVGDSLSAALLSQKLFRCGINVQPVTYPAVPAKLSRLRFFLTAMHKQSDIETALDTVAEEMRKMPDMLRALKLLDMGRVGTESDMEGELQRILTS